MIRKMVNVIICLSLMINGFYATGNGDSISKATKREKDFIVLSISGKNLTKATNNYQHITNKTSNIQTKFNYVAVCKMDAKEASQLDDNNDLIVEEDQIMRASTESKTILRGKKLDVFWNSKMIKAKKRLREKQTKKVKIAVLDSGIDWGNDIELKESISFVPDEEGMNPLFMDGSGHGNSVAGLIAARDNGRGITGINPQAEIYSIRVLDDENEAPVSRVIQGIYYAINKKVNIINMSFGMPQYSDALKQAIDDAQRAGILVVAAAGNTSGKVEYPAAFPSVLSVGSVDSCAEIADSSAKGDKVNIVAPGELVCTTGEFGDMLIASGTSLAAPQVTAVASVLWQENPSATNELIKHVLIQSANYNTPEGYGLVDEKYAIENYSSIAEEYYTKKSKEEQENTSKIYTNSDTGCVKGSWTQSIHESLVGSGHSNVKQGARYPDKNSRFKTITSNPGWHGSYNVNYIAAYIYATRMAEQLGNGKSATKASKPNGLTNAEATNMLGDVNSLDWTALGMTTNGKQRAFAWGMAMHTAADIFAHSAFVYSNGKWNHLAHGGTHNGEAINNYADNTSKFDGRFYSAENIVHSIVEKYDAKNGSGSYKEFRGIDASKKDYRLRDLVDNIKETTSDNIGNPYTAFNLSNSSVNKGIIEYYWRG